MLIAVWRVHVDITSQTDVTIFVRVGREYETNYNIDLKPLNGSSKSATSALTDNKKNVSFSSTTMLYG